MWPIHTLEHDPAVKSGEVPTLATMWMDLGNVRLRERSQAQKASWCFHFCEVSRSGRSTEAESGGGEWGATAQGNRAFLGGRENVLELDGSAGCIKQNTQGLPRRAKINNYRNKLELGSTNYISQAKSGLPAIFIQPTN